MDTGIRLTDNILFSELEFADDAALPNETTIVATQRLTHLQSRADEEAGMLISIPKTKCQHIMPTPTVSHTTEQDVEGLPAEKQFKFVCDKCSMTYPTQHGLSVHKGRHCKKRKTAKKPSRKGTVADRVVKWHKIEQLQRTFDKVSIGTEEIDNVYSFVYLGAEVPADGNPDVTIQHRCNIAWGSFNNYRKSLTAAKLPIQTRIKLYRSIVVETMVYGSSAWMFTDKMRRKVNGVNSKMLSQITKRTIHVEAKEPRFNTIEHVLARRWEYLGHILRLDDHRALKRYVVDLSPGFPYQDGSLFSDTNFQDVGEMLDAASDRNRWKEERGRRSRVWK